MSELKLVNPQPMETLPEEGTVFLEYTPELEPNTRRIWQWHVTLIRRYQERTGYTFHAWSYTATFEKGGGNG